MTDPLVAIVTFPSAQILDVTGPLEVFSSASRFLPSVHYRTELVSSAGEGRAQRRGHVGIGVNAPMRHSEVSPSARTTGSASA
jgi:transcriptional regulator GlxA family with amidase domain